MEQPIFITGIERSGSSIVAKVISHCGAFSGKTTAMGENLGIKKLVDSYYTQILNIPNNGQFPLPNPRQLQIPQDWQNRVDHIIEEEPEYNQSIEKWMYKSSRISQIWPIWSVMYPDAKWVIVRRRTGDIIHSCIKTGFMTAFSKKENQQAVHVKTEHEGWLWWVWEHEARFIEMINSGINHKVVWPERMAMGDFEQMKETVEWLGLEWKDDIKELVLPMLKNSNQRK